MFADLVGKRGDASVFDCNPVEGLETVDDTERFAVLLDDAKPAGAIRRVGGLVYSRVELAPDDAVIC